MGEGGGLYAAGFCQGLIVLLLRVEATPVPLGLLSLPTRAQQPKLNERLQLDSLDQAYQRYEERRSAVLERAQADS